MSIWFNSFSKFVNAMAIRLMTREWPARPYREFEIDDIQHHSSSQLWFNWCARMAVNLCEHICRKAKQKKRKKPNSFNTNLIEFDWWFGWARLSWICISIKDNCNEKLVCLLWCDFYANHELINWSINQMIGNESHVWPNHFWWSFNAGLVARWWIEISQVLGLECFVCLKHKAHSPVD